MSSDTDGAWPPTRTSNALALGVTVATVAVLLWQVRPVAVPALVGSAGAVAFALSLWLAGTRRGTVPAAAASLLTAVAAAGILAGTLGTVLSLLGALFPVRDTALLSGRILLLVGHLGVAAGAGIAVLGATLGAGNVARGRTLATHYRLTVGSLTVPGAVAGALILGSLSTGAGPTGAGAAGRLAADLLGWLLAPAAGTHLATLAGLVALAALSVRAAVGALPVAELLDGGPGRVQADRVRQCRRGLGWVVASAGLIGGAALVVELSVPSAVLRSAVGPAAYDAVAAASGLSPLRVALAGLTALALPVAAAVTLLRRAARASREGIDGLTGPLVGGGVATVLALAVAGPVQRWLLAWTADSLPGAFGTTFREVASSVVAFYGPGTVVVALVAVLIGVTALTVLGVRVAVATGALPAGTPGYALAGSGLFVAAAFAGTIPGPAWLVFGGVVAGLFVWDVGRYGSVLGREVGGGTATRDAELVHAGGTLAVGLLGTVGAVGLTSVVGPGSLPSTPATVGALVCVLAGLVFLVAALR